MVTRTETPAQRQKRIIEELKDESARIRAEIKARNRRRKEQEERQRSLVPRPQPAPEAPAVEPLAAPVPQRPEVTGELAVPGAPPRIEAPARKPEAAPPIGDLLPPPTDEVATQEQGLEELEELTEQQDLLRQGFDAIQRLRPEIARNLGPGVALQELSEEFAENPDAFLQTLFDLRHEEQADQFKAAQRHIDVETILKLFFDFTNEQVAQFFAPKLDDLVAELFPDNDLDGVLSLAENNPDTFFGLLRKKGRTKETQDFLRLLGMEWEAINTFFGTGVTFMEIDGVRQQATVLDNGMVLDSKGQEVGRMDPVTSEFQPYQYRLGDSWKAFTAGVGDVIATAGGAANWLGQDGIGESLTEFGRHLQLQAPPDTLGEFSWQHLYNPRWWATKPIRTTAFTLALIPGAIVGSWAGAAVAGAAGVGAFGTFILRVLGAAAMQRPIEAALEAGGTYDEALALGMTKKEAREAADKVFKNNLILVGADAVQIAAAFAPSSVRVSGNLIRRGLVTTARVGGRLTIVGLTEAGEEFYQEVIQRMALGQEITWDAEMQEAVALGLIQGVGFGAGGQAYTNLKDKVIAAMPTDVRARFDTRVSEIISDERGGIGGRPSNKDRKNAEEKALDEVTEEVAEITEAVVEQEKITDFEAEVKPETEADKLAWKETFEQMREDAPQIPLPPLVPLAVTEGITTIQGLLNENRKAASLTRIEATIGRLELTEDDVAGLDAVQDAIDEYRDVEREGLTIEEFNEAKAEAFEAVEEALGELEGVEVEITPEEVEAEAVEEEAVAPIQPTEVTEAPPITEAPAVAVEAPAPEVAEAAPPAPPAPPEGPPPPAPPTEPPSDDFAANIRLTKYPEDIRATIGEWADAHPEEVAKARRGVVSDKKVLDDARQLAEDMGGNFKKVQKGWKPGEAWNAEEIVAIRGALRAKTELVIETAQAAHLDNSSQNIARMQLAIQEQARIQEIVHGVTAEAGRALRSFRQEAFNAIEANDTERLEELLRRLGDRGKMDEIAAAIASGLDLSNPTAVNTFIRKMQKPSLWDFIIEFYYNSILSGPKTHIVNLVTTGISTMISPLERVTAAAFERVIAPAQNREVERFFAEAPAEAFGLIRGFPEGVRAGLSTMRHGITPASAAKWEFGKTAFKGNLGRVIRSPGTALAAADVMWYSINYRTAINTLTLRKARGEKLTGEALIERVAELTVNPTEELVKEASKIAENRIFRSEPGEFTQKLIGFRDAKVFGMAPLRLVIPFLRTPVNLVKFGLERTPLGLANPHLWRSFAQKSPEFSDQIARVFLGSALLAFLAFQLGDDKITGAAPKGKAERDRFFREGKIPFAVRIGDKWLQFQRLEPFNQVFGMLAAAVDALKAEDANALELVKLATFTMAENLVSQTYLSGLNDFVSMIVDPKRKGSQYFTRLLSTGIPFSSALRTAAQMTDTTFRRPRTLAERLQAGIPGLSKNVPPIITALGEEAPRESPAFSPFQVTSARQSKVDAELGANGVEVTFVGDSIGGKELTEDGQNLYQHIAGQLIGDELTRVIEALGYEAKTDAQKKELLQKTIDDAKKEARNRVSQDLENFTAEARKILKAELVVAEDMLGVVIEVPPEFSGDAEIIFDTARLFSQTKKNLSGLTEEALKGLGVPSYVGSFFDASNAQKKEQSLPNQPLFKINADSERGTTFDQYHQQWKRLQELTDPLERAEWLADHPNAFLGNFTKRDLELLKRFHAADSDTQAKMLIDNPRLSVDIRDAWLKANPKENALLAVWGQAKIRTRDALDEFDRLVRALDFPDDALPELTLPPRESIDTHFAYEDHVTAGTFNSWEAQLLLAKDPTYEKWLGRIPGDTTIEALEFLVADRPLYDEAQRLRDTLDGKELEKALDKLRAKNPKWVDNIRRVQAMRIGTREVPTSDKIVEGWVQWGRVSEKFGSASAESRIWRFDNQLVYQWGLEKGLLTDEGGLKGGDWNIPALRIRARWRRTEEEFQGLKDDDVRETFLDEHAAFRKDRRRLLGFQLGVSERDIEKHVELYELSSRGFRRDRWLQEHQDYYKNVWLNPDVLGNNEVDFTRIPNERFDDLQDKWEDQLDSYFSDIPGRAKLFRDNPGFFRARLEWDALRRLVPQPAISGYIQYYSALFEGKPEGWDRWWQDDRILRDNPALYQWLLKTQGWEERDFDLIPSVAFENSYNETYINLRLEDGSADRAARSDFRRAHPSFDEEGARIGLWVGLGVEAPTRRRVRGRGVVGTPRRPITPRTSLAIR